MKRVWKRFRVPKRVIKVFLTLLAALLTFGGPTYAMSVLENLGVPHLLYLLLGLALFTAGVILFIRLFGEKAESSAST